MTFFWSRFGFEKWFGNSSWSNHWASHCWLLYKIHFSSHITIWLRNDPLFLHRIREDNTSKNYFFKIFGHLMRHPLIKVFHHSNLLQMPNYHRMVDVEFFSKFSCCCNRISFDDCSQLVIVNFQWLAAMLLIFKTHISWWEESRWRRNRTGWSRSLLQIHWKNNRTVNKVYKTTSDR